MSAQYIPYLYDLILLAIVVITFVVNYKKGLLGILLGVASWIAALILAYVVSGLFAGFGNGSVSILNTPVPTTRPVIFLVVFIIGSFVLNFVFKGLQKAVDKIPLVGATDRLLGGILGAALGLICCYVLLNLCAIIIHVHPMPWMNEQVMDATILVKYLYRFNLITIASQ